MTRVGLVLSGGGIVGHAYHAGTLAGLQRRTGWDPRTAEVVIGTSAGANLGALLRAGFDAGDLAAQVTGDVLSPEGAVLAARMPARGGRLPAPTFAHMGRGMAAGSLLLRAAITPWRFRPGVVGAAAMPPGKLSAETVAAPLRPLFESGWPGARLWIPAVRLDDGRRVVFGRAGAPDTGVGDAVAASCAIPGYFAPVEIAGRRYVDGGVWSVTNADLAATESLDLVLILSPMSTARSGIPGAVGVAFRAAVRASLRRERALLERRGTRVAVYEPGAELARLMGDGPWTPATWRRTARLARDEAELARDLPPGLGQPPLPVG